MSEIISTILMLIGVFFMLVAGIGIVRMPDLYLRMSASTKAATLGVGFVILSVATYFGSIAIATRAIAIIVFLLLTAPVAAHLIGRESYHDGVPLWEGTLFDKLKGRYDPQFKKLSGMPGQENS